MQAGGAIVHASMMGWVLVQRSGKQYGKWGGVMEYSICKAVTMQRDGWVRAVTKHGTNTSKSSTINLLAT
jgi:hypothetical protein